MTFILLHFRNPRFGNSGFECKDNENILIIKVFSTILSSIISLVSIQSFPKYRFRKQKFIKYLLLYQFPYIEKIFSQKNFFLLLPSHPHKCSSNALFIGVSSVRADVRVGVFTLTLALTLSLLPSLFRQESILLVGDSMDGRG